MEGLSCMYMGASNFCRRGAVDEPMQRGRPEPARTSRSERGRGPIVQSSRSHALLRPSVTRPATHAQQTVVIRVALPATLRGHREAGIGAQTPIP